MSQEALYWWQVQQYDKRKILQQQKNMKKVLEVMLYLILANLVMEEGLKMEN